MLLDIVYFSIIALCALALVCKKAEIIHYCESRTYITCDVDPSDHNSWHAGIAEGPIVSASIVHVLSEHLVSRGRLPLIFKW